MRTHKVIALTAVCPEHYILRIERQGLDFKPGQYVQISIAGTEVWREYSIYSGLDDDYLEFFFKRIAEGEMSSALAQLQQGDSLLVEGPLGFFSLKDSDFTVPPLFIALGTGIAPFHSLVKSYPQLTHDLWCGLRSIIQFPHAEDFTHIEYFISQKNPQKLGQKESSNSNIHNLRLDDYLKQQNRSFFANLEQKNIYLCGGITMLNSLSEILMDNDIDYRSLFMEQYY